MRLFTSVSLGLLPVFILLISTAGAGTTVFDIGSRPPAGQVSGSLLPAKPSGYILDETDVISGEQRKDLSKLLNGLPEDGIEIFVTELKNVPEIEPYQLGNEVLLRWGKTDVRFSILVLSLPPVSPEPYIFIYHRSAEKQYNARLRQIGQEAIQAGEAEDMRGELLTEVVRHLARSVGEIQSALVAEKAAAESISAPVSNVVPGESAPRLADALLDPKHSAADRGLLKEQETTPLSRLLDRVDGMNATPFVIAAAVVGGLACVVMLFFIHRAAQPKYFPEVIPRKRFSAPYSGGNNAIIRITSRKSSKHGHSMSNEW